MGLSGFVNDVKKNFQQTSFKDVLIMTERPQTSAIIGIDSDKTQLQRIEDYHKTLASAAGALSKVPGLGAVASQIQEGAEFAAGVLDPINRAIDEQDAAAKQGKGNFKHFKNIGVSAGKALHKGHKVVHPRSIPMMNSSDAHVLQHTGEVEVVDGVIQKKNTGQSTFVGNGNIITDRFYTPSE